MRLIETIKERIAYVKQLLSLRWAKKKANEYHELTGKRMHVVLVGDEYKIYDRNGMLQIEKICKKNGHDIDWHDLVIYSTE